MHLQGVSIVNTGGWVLHTTLQQYAKRRYINSKKIIESEEYSGVTGRAINCFLFISYMNSRGGIALSCHVTMDLPRFMGQYSSIWRQ